MFNSPTRDLKDTSKSLSLKANFFWVLSGNIFFGLSQWLVISFMSKFGNVDMVGEYTLALGLTAPIFLLLNFNLRSMQATDQKDEFSFVYYFSFRNITSTTAFLILIIILMFLDYSMTTMIVIFIVGINKFIESQSDVVFGHFQKIEYMSLISISKIIKGTLNVLTITIALLVSNSLVIALIGMVVTNLLIFSFFDMRNLYKNNVKRIKTKDLLFVFKDKKKLFSILIMGLPLGIASSLDSLTINSQRYIIEYSLSITEVGYYSSITYLMISGQTIVGALSRAVLPRLTKYFLEDIKKYIKSILFLVILGVIMGVVLIIISYFFGGFILSVLYTEEFVSYSNIFVIIMIVASVWYLTGFLNSALLATRKFNSQLIVYLLSFIVTFIFTIILTNDLGLLGSAYALLAGMITRLLVISLILFNIISKERKKGMYA